MKTQKTITTCDVCGNDVEEANDGVVRLSKHSEIRFDICADDVTKLFGEIAPSKRRGAGKLQEA
jgi:hypothetical protein